MPAWTIGSVTFADPASMSNAAGIVAGKYWHGQVRVLTPQFERRAYAYPGVNGLAIKRFGFRGREINGEVIYFGADQAALRTAIEADRTALANTTFTCTPPDGAAFPNCQLDSLPDGEFQPAGNNLFMLRTVLTVLQLRQ